MLQHIVFDLGVGCPILKFGHIHIFQRELNPNLFRVDLALGKQDNRLKGEIIVLESSDLAYPDITGTKVHHKKFGAGLVKQCVDNGLVISFECGEKQLQYSVCVENGILDFESQNVFEVREKILENQDKLREYRNKLIEIDKNIRIIEEKLK